MWAGIRVEEGCENAWQLGSSSLLLHFPPLSPQHQPLPTLCRWNAKGITFSQHLPSAQGDHHPTPHPRQTHLSLSLSVPHPLVSKPLPT